ncbi:hypothetical protein D3C76_1632780 [compost metagenome]
MPISFAASMTVLPASASSSSRGACLLRSISNLLMWEVPNKASFSPRSPAAISCIEQAEQMVREVILIDNREFTTPVLEIQNARCGASGVRLKKM